MVIRTLAVAAAILFLTPLAAFAKGSCATFATFKSYDPTEQRVVLKFQKGNQRKYFPKPDGSPNMNKLPKKCSGKIKKLGTFPVKPLGGRMTITQVRSNVDGKMLNDTEDATWLPGVINKLVADKTQVAVVIRQGMTKDSPYGVTTIYMPVTQEELDDIKRLEAQAVDE
jgi:hypothetical protein